MAYLSANASRTLRSTVGSDNCCGRRLACRCTVPSGQQQVGSSWYHSQIGVNVPEYTVDIAWRAPLARFDNVIMGTWTLFQVRTWLGGAAYMVGFLLRCVWVLRRSVSIQSSTAAKWLHSTPAKLTLGILYVSGSPHTHACEFGL
jgi:hypothetical protein